MLKKALITSELLSPIIFTISDHDMPFAYSIPLIFLMEQTINIFGRIDVLINNASIAEKTAVRETNHTSRSSSSSPTNLDTSQYKQASSLL